MWRWADEQGEQRLVDADELRAAIANGVLPPSTLVWREGMSVWVPAISVEEFAEALPNVTDGGTQVQHVPTNLGAAAKNVAAAGPSRATLQGLAARDMVAAVKAQETTKGPEQEPAKEKRTPSVAPPPRPAVGSVKPPLVKTLRPNTTGPAVPAAPRLPSEIAPKPGLGPRPLGAVRPAAATTTPSKAPAPAPAPAPRPPSTTAIDKDWSITDDETTNVPGKTTPPPARPEPPPEAPSPLEAPSPRAPHPSRTSIVITTPPPGALADRRPTNETTESTTFQFAKNTLSLRSGKLPPDANDDNAENANATKSPGEAPRVDAPPGLLESYGKQPVTVSKAGADDPPPTSPSADLELADDLIPAYAGSTVRMEGLQEQAQAALRPAVLQEHPQPAARPAPLPEPPKVREPTVTTMLPIDYQEPEPTDVLDKLPHEVSQTVRFSADFMNKVASASPLPGGGGATTARIDTNDAATRAALAQLKTPTGASSPAMQNGAQDVAAQSGASRPVHFPAAGAPTSAPLPLNAVLMSGAMLVMMVIGSFFVGRCSVKPSANNLPFVRTGFWNAARAVQDNLPTAPKPCWVVKQPARWAPFVSKNVSFELLTLASGKLAIGYAKTDDEAVGIEVMTTTGQVNETYSDKASSGIARVTPTGKGFFISTAEPPGNLKWIIPISAEKPFYVGISDKDLAWSDQPSGTANRVWPIGDEDASGGIRAFSLGSRGILTALRTGSPRQKKVFAGLLGADRKPLTNLVNVVGSGGLAGEPMLGSNGREVAVVFGDQAGEQSAWKIRIGHAPIGKIPTTTTAFDPPSGGPGGDANHPSIGGLADGRWVVVWTEGSSSSKTVRAQTFAPTFTTIGDPIVLSPPLGTYGSSMVGVIGNYVTVVFVLKGKSNNELWGTVLQCG